jgi:hypothetical protein
MHMDGKKPDLAHTVAAVVVLSPAPTGAPAPTGGHFWTVQLRVRPQLVLAERCERANLSLVMIRSVVLNQDHLLVSVFLFNT